jgi:thiol-disulfide isomerase/thioredoxin
MIAEGVTKVSFTGYYISMSIRLYRFAPSRPCIIAGTMIFIAAFFAMPGCSPAPPECTFSYSQQQSGNVSTIVWPVGAARSSTQDGYAPDFKWRSSNGTLDSLSNHIGQIVIVNFWASWCGPCTSEMPAIQNIADSLGDSLFVVGVGVDECSPWSSVSGFVKSNNIKYQIAVDSEWTLYEKYFPNALSSEDFTIPQTLFIGRDGTIKRWQIGEENESAFLSNIHLTE